MLIRSSSLDPNDLGREGIMWNDERCLFAPRRSQQRRDLIQTRKERAPGQEGRECGATSHGGSRVTLAMAGYKERARARSRRKGACGDVSCRPCAPDSHSMQLPAPGAALYLPVAGQPMSRPHTAARDIPLQSTGTICRAPYDVGVSVRINIAWREQGHAGHGWIQGKSVRQVKKEGAPPAVRT